MVANIAYRRLSSGECHIYRGVLNYEGHQLESAFRTACTRLVGTGVYDRATCDTDLVNIQREIAEAG